MKFFDTEKIKNFLLPRERVVLFSDISDDKRKISDGVRSRITSLVDSWDGYCHREYGDTYGEFYENGNRCNFEDVYINRRAHLIDMVIYEVFIGGGKYYAAIENMIRKICDEDLWCVPSHTKHNKSSEASSHIIELYAAETASVLAVASYYLADKLSHDIKGLIAEKIEERMFTPYTETDKYGWMGVDGHKVNNWNPWINTNVCFCAALVCEDEERYRNLVIRAAALTENYINSLPEDSLCDEGARYWVLSAGCLFDMCEILYDLTGGALDLTKTRVLWNACDYITGIYDEYGHPANFADATFDFYPECALIVRMGERTGNDLLRDMGRSLYRDDSLRIYHDNFYRQIKDIYTASSITPIDNFKYPEMKLLRGINICTMRKNGFLFSLKANHNGESHNHNDIGSFVVYFKGEPIFIDPGVDLYSKISFSKQRFDLWYMRSDFHNVPTIAGKLQSAGEQFAATPLEVSDMSVSTDISGAYGPDLSPWVRRADFSGDFIIVEDSFTQSEGTVMNYMLAEKPIIEGDTIIFKSGVKAILSGVRDIAIEELDITGKNPPDGITGDAPFRIPDERSYLIPKLFEKQWGKKVLYKLSAIPTGDKVTLKIISK